MSTESLSSHPPPLTAAGVEAPVPQLAIRNVSKRFGTKVVLRNVSLAVNAGEAVQS